VLALREGLDSQGLGAPDFWVALGYDFVRFVHSLGPIPPDWVPEQVNSLLAGAGNMEFSMARLKYEPNGQARQELWLFQPSVTGMAPLDADFLQHQLEQARKRQEWVKATETGSRPHRQPTPTEGD